MILDVGGGSSEIALIGHGEILVVESHDVGGVRLLERAGSGPPERVLRMIEATLKSSRFPILDFFKRQRIHSLVGTGGNIETIAILKKYDPEPKHAKRVSALAVSLFDQLKSSHGLGKRDRLLLELAALLHEVGNFIGSSGHHRHSFYIVSQSPILGLSDDELL